MGQRMTVNSKLRLPKNTKERYNIETRQAADQNCKEGRVHMSEQGTMIKDRASAAPAPASHIANDQKLLELIYHSSDPSKAMEIAISTILHFLKQT